MWQVENRTPFAAERGWVRDPNGAEVWIVAVRATFDIHPDGTAEIAPDQPPALRVAEHFGDPGSSSLKYEADLIPTKVATDVVVVGHAYSPTHRPVTELDVGVRVGPMQKMLRVFGDRVWGEVAPSTPEFFTSMPLIYERAFGGVDTKSDHPERDWDWRNPVGRGFAVAPEHVRGLPLPNIEYPDQLVRSWRDRPAPAGLGAVPSHWQPRVAFAGTYDDQWMRDRHPLVPSDFDDRFFQCSPPDQQVSGFLKGGEPVLLYHLTSDAEELRFSLPKMFLGFDTQFYDGTHELHRARRLHTVILEPDYPRVSLVWHTALPCHFKVQKLRRTIITLKTDVRKAYVP